MDARNTALRSAKPGHPTLMSLRKSSRAVVLTLQVLSMAMLRSRRWLWIFGASRMSVRNPNDLDILTHALGSSREHIRLTRTCHGTALLIGKANALSTARSCKAYCSLE